MEVIKVIDNAIEVLKPLIDMLELSTPNTASDYSDLQITGWDDEVVVVYRKQIFSMGWLEVRKLGKNDVSLSYFERHPVGDEYFINLFPKITLFIPVIEIDREHNIIDHQIVKLLSGQACIMPARVIHAGPFQNQKEKGVMLIFKRYNLARVSVSTRNPFRFQLEI